MRTHPILIVLLVCAILPPKKGRAFAERERQWLEGVAVPFLEDQGPRVEHKPTYLGITWGLGETVATYFGGAVE